MAKGPEIAWHSTRYLVRGTPPKVGELCRYHEPSTYIGWGQKGGGRQFSSVRTIHRHRCLSWAGRQVAGPRVGPCHVLDFLSHHSRSRERNDLPLAMHTPDHYTVPRYSPLSCGGREKRRAPGCPSSCWFTIPTWWMP